MAHINRIDEMVSEAKIRKLIDDEVKLANDYLKEYGLSVVYNSKYNFEGYSKNFVAVYQKDSVKRNGKIRIGVNIPYIQSNYKNEIQQQVEMSIWHEVGHGIIEYLKGLRRKDTQCGTKIFKGKMLKDFRNIIDDDEYYVEEFGDYNASHGNAFYSSLDDFLHDYENELLALRNQDGGSKWLEQLK